MGQRKQPHILVFYTETGGTHANTARAIIEAVQRQTGNRCTVELLDVWKYARFPIKYLPKMLFWFRERRPLSRWHVQHSDQRQRLIYFNRLARPYLQKMIPQILADHPCDCIVSVHPLTSAPLLEVMPENNTIPFWVVVTDIATRNTFWFDQSSAMTIVPTVKAMNFAAQTGLSFHQLRLLGVPVLQSYSTDPHQKEQVCAGFNLDPMHPIILVAGGKKGVGPLDAVAERIDERFEAVNLVILTGRNENLKKRLEEYNWRNKVRIFGYVNDLWRLMWIADVMVTKAGTGMLAEALNVKLPMILFHRVPYFEDANVSFLVEHGAALWAPSPRMAVNALARWLDNPDELQKAKQVCRRLAKPEAALELAQMISDQAWEVFQRE